MAILADLNDPRIVNVTLTRVEVSGDMREAKVYVSVMGEEKQQQLCMHGLRSAAGFLQSKIAKRIDTRYTPRIEFVLDRGVKQSIEIHRILDEILPTPVETTSVETTSVETTSDETPDDETTRTTPPDATMKDPSSQ